MTAMRLKRYPSPSGGFALGKVGVGATMLKQGKTARDYIQDGLVAMWDGIENAGWGVHDANATSWVDLVGNRDLSLVGSTIWESNCLITKGGGAETTGEISYNTIEICTKRESGNGLFCAGGYSWGVVLFFDNFVRFSCRANRRVAIPIAGKASTFAATGGGGRSFANNTAYRDGVSSIVVNNSNWNPSPIMNIGNFTATGVEEYIGEIYCLRLYSRALTAAEIAANYAIDKERFNLP